MFEKEIEEITEIFDKQVFLLKRTRIGLLTFCGFANVVLGFLTYQATSQHSGWMIPLYLAWIVLVIETYRLWKTKL